MEGRALRSEGVVRTEALPARKRRNVNKEVAPVEEPVAGPSATPAAGPAPKPTEDNRYKFV